MNRKREGYKVLMLAIAELLSSNGSLSILRLPLFKSDFVIFFFAFIIQVI